MFDVAIVGSGPAGLAVAIEGARRGLSIVVLEKNDGPPDKACGEGVMPGGVRLLAELGVLQDMPLSDCRPFQGITYIDRDGLRAEGRLASPGLAIRRLALVRAMSEQAERQGARLLYGCKVESHRRHAGAIELATSTGVVEARMLVAADGLSSRLRRSERLDAPERLIRRYGLRRHFRRAPWSTSIEVHLGEGAEAYVTPVSSSTVGVAFLWAEPLPDASGRPADGPRSMSYARFAIARWDRLSCRFPLLLERLTGAAPDSELRGAGPLAQRSRRRTADRFALVGDAAGYFDALTGEGISLSLSCAHALARLLPDALAHGADRRALEPYEREFLRLYARYELAARATLAVVGRRWARRAFFSVFRMAPRLLDRALAEMTRVA